MKKVGKWSDEQVAEARKMLANGLSLKAVGERFGVSGDTVRCKTDPAYRLKRCEQNNLNRAVQRRHEKPAKAVGRYYVERAKPDQDCVAARLAEIPRDTRDLTARIFGDPIPGRRALDRIRQGDVR